MDMELCEILVSVVMPAFNCGKTIGQAVGSALCQNVPLELLIVVDGPSPETEKALMPWARDGRVRILRNGRNLGVSASRNRGIRAARGKYVAFLDADDIWLPGKLEKQVRLLEENGQCPLSLMFLATKPFVGTGSRLQGHYSSCSSCFTCPRIKLNQEKKT